MPAQFLQSKVELPRIEILRRTAAEVLAQLDLPTATWETVRTEQVAREATGPEGHHAELEDAVVVLRRR